MYPLHVTKAIALFYFGESYPIVDSRHLETTYLEQLLISKWKSGPGFNMEL